MSIIKQLDFKIIIFFTLLHMENPAWSKLVCHVRQIRNSVMEFAVFLLNKSLSDSFVSKHVHDSFSFF